MDVALIAIVSALAALLASVFELLPWLRKHVAAYDQIIVIDLRMSTNSLDAFTTAHEDIRDVVDGALRDRRRGEQGQAEMFFTGDGIVVVLRRARAATAAKVALRLMERLPSLRESMAIVVDNIPRTSRRERPWATGVPETASVARIAREAEPGMIFFSERYLDTVQELGNRARSSGVRRDFLPFDSDRPSAYIGLPPSHEALWFGLQ